MADKIKIASDWLAGCAGCHMSLLDLDERLLEVLQHADLTATPLTDLKHAPTTGVDVGIVEGAVANSANEAALKLLRSRCGILVALGDCAVFGGIPTLRNCVCREAALRRAYQQAESVVDGKVPDDPELAVIQDARAVDQVVDVDIRVPGCPPSADTIFFVLKELLAGRKPVLSAEHLDWH